MCVDFDAEGSGTWKLIISEYECYVICDDEFTRIYSFTENGDEIAKDILKYIEMYFEDWVDWLCWDESEDIYIDILSNKFYILKVLKIIFKFVALSVAYITSEITKPS